MWAIIWIGIVLLIGVIFYFLFLSESAVTFQEEYQESVKKQKAAYEEQIISTFKENGVIPINQYAIKDGTYIGVDENNKKVCFLLPKPINKKNITPIYQLNHTAETYSYKDILESEVVIDGETVTKTSRKSQLGGALIGGVLTGGIGALIGGLSGKTTSTEKVNKIHLRLIVNNFKKPVLTLTFLDEEFSISKDKPKYIEAHNKVMEIHSLFVLIINIADKEDQKLTENPLTLSNNATKETDEFNPLDNLEKNIPYSIADEIKKFFDLYEKGIITKDEFESQKQKTLEKG